MKKSLLYLFALICSMGIFTACSDDDELTMSQVIETELAGTYEGKLGISVMVVSLQRILRRTFLCLSPQLKTQ